MTTGAIIMMVITMGVVSGIAGYFFWKVLTTPRKSDTEKEEEERPGVQG